MIAMFEQITPKEIKPSKHRKFFGQIGHTFEKSAKTLVEAKLAKIFHR